MLSPDCMLCLINKQMEYTKNMTDEEKRTEYIRGVLKLIAASDKPAPAVIEENNRLYREFFGSDYSYEKIKKDYNDYLLAREDHLFSETAKAEDSLLDALKLAMTGNYIDFAYMGSVNKEKLDALLSEYRERSIDPEAYSEFRTKLNESRELLYISDNCGEIILDKIFIRQLKKYYPQLNITLLVRGGAVINDVTVKDAEYVGLKNYCKVVGNGTAVAGTYLPEISDEARVLINKADIIISKGQGNFETLFEEKLNIYFVFLCKCAHFTKKFGLERYSGVFLKQ